MLNFVIGIYSFYTLLKIYLSIMQIGYINQEKKKEAVILPPGRYLVAGNYAVAKEKLSILETFVDYLLFLWFIFFGFKWLQNLFGTSGFFSSLLFIFGFFAINFIISLPFTIYSKFKIDKEFGFNKMTPKMFVIDTLKGIALFLIFGGVVFLTLIWIIENFKSWWIWGFILLFGVALLINLIYPTIIAPLFNKFTPLEDGELKQSIEKMMKEVGLSSDGIFVMDASKRDTRLNAYFGGLGKSKRVVLFDTLLEKLTNKELLAVLGHELGHYSHKDVWKNIAMMGIFLFVAFYIFGHFPEEIFIQIGVVPTGGVILALIILLLPVLNFVYTPILSFLSRHNEYEADKFGSKIGGRENLISALLKLVKENKSFPKSDPIYSKFYYSHPPIIERLKALGFDVDKPLPKDGIFQFIKDEDR